MHDTLDAWGGPTMRIYVRRLLRGPVRDMEVIPGRCASCEEAREDAGEPPLGTVPTRVVAYNGRRVCVRCYQEYESSWARQRQLAEERRSAAARRLTLPCPGCTGGFSPMIGPLPRGRRRPLTEGCGLCGGFDSLNPNYGTFAIDTPLCLPAHAGA